VKEIRTMKKYVEFEARQIKMVKRGLETVHDAITLCIAYLTCMVDNEIITSDRSEEETTRMVGMFLYLEMELNNK
jgi:hypothetical protein